MLTSGRNGSARPETTKPRRAGIKIARIEQIVTAVPAQDFFAPALNMNVGEATLLMVRRIYDDKDRLVDILYCHHNPRRFHFRLRLDADAYRG